MRLKIPPEDSQVDGGTVKHIIRGTGELARKGFKVDSVQFGVEDNQGTEQRVIDFFYDDAKVWTRAWRKLAQW